MSEDTAAAATTTTNDGAAAAATTETTTTDTTAATATEADWRSTITDPEHLEFAKRTASVADLAKVASDLRKANGSMIRVPSKDAKPEDIQKFNKAIGVPEKAEDYKFDLGREPTDADRAIQGEVGKIFHANGVPASAATAVSKAISELAMAQQAEENRVAVENRNKAEADLKKEFGADFDKNINVAKRAVELYGGDELKDFFDKTVVNGAKLGDHPAMIRAWAKIGLRMDEGGFIGAATADQRQSLEQERDQIMRENDPMSDAYRSPKIQNRLREINQSLYGNRPVVGAAGRTA